MFDSNANLSKWVGGQPRALTNMCTWLPCYLREDLQWLFRENWWGWSSSMTILGGMIYSKARITHCLCTYNCLSQDPLHARLSVQCVCVCVCVCLWFPAHLIRPCLHENVFGWKRKLFFADTRFVYTKTVKTRTKTFSLQKRYPKWKLLKTTTFWRRVNRVNDVCEVEMDRFVGVPVGVDKRATWQTNAWFSSALFYYFYWWSRCWMSQRLKSTLPSNCFPSTHVHTKRHPRKHAYKPPPIDWIHANAKTHIRLRVNAVCVFI